jgi:hypothetical protein
VETNPAKVCDESEIEEMQEMLLLENDATMRAEIIV